MNVFRKFKAFLRFREAVKQADQAHALNRRCFYVLPSVGNKLVVMDRKNFRELRRKRYISRNAKVPQLKYMSVYHTPDARGMGGVPPEYLREKFHDYLRWMEQYDK